MRCKESSKGHPLHPSRMGFSDLPQICSSTSSDFLWFLIWWPWRGTPKSSFLMGFSTINHYKPTIWDPHLWKPPFDDIWCFQSTGLPGFDPGPYIFSMSQWDCAGISTWHQNNLYISCIYALSQHMGKFGSWSACLETTGGSRIMAFKGSLSFLPRISTIWCNMM